MTDTTAERMRLVNFSGNPIEFDPNRTYVDCEEGMFKPSGLWLSNENDYGWKEYCNRVGYEGGGFTYEQEFELVEGHNVLVITEEREFIAFHEKYSVSLTRFHAFIDWNRVKEDYDGILITQYFWQFRTSHIWYYGWDCASGCVWNLEAIKPVAMSEVTA